MDPSEAGFCVELLVAIASSFSAVLVAPISWSKKARMFLNLETVISKLRPFRTTIHPRNLEIRTDFDRKVWPRGCSGFLCDLGQGPMVGF